MKFNILNPELKKALDKLAKIKPATKTLPILDTILIEAGKGVVTLSRTNLEAALVIRLDAQIDKDGEICVNLKELKDFVKSGKKFQFETLELVKQNDDDAVNRAVPLVVTSDAGRLTLMTIPANEYPLILNNWTKSDDSHFISQFPLSRVQLERIYQTCDGSYARDDARPVLTGMLFKWQETGLTCATTDGYVLNIYEDTSTPIEPIQFTLPGNNFGLMSKMFSEGVSVKVFGTKSEIDPTMYNYNGPINWSKVEITGSNWTFMTRLIDGYFPNYQQIIPTASPFVYVIDKDKMQQVIHPDAEFENITHFAFNEDTLTVESGGILSQNNFKYSSTIPVRVLGSADSFRIAFDANFMLKLLKALDSNDVIFYLSGKASPGLISNKQTNYSQTFVIMPMNLFK